MLTNKKQNFLNIVSNLFALIIQFAINFFVVPKIVNNLGTEAVGYVNLSNDIVGYFSIVTVVFNSVAGRFISIEINNNHYSKASEYLNSVILANAVICSAIAIFGAFFIPNIDSVLNISAYYLNEVKITFMLTWITSIVSIMASVFTIGTFATNKLNINAVRNIVSYLVRITIIIALFAFLPLKVYFLPIATLASTVFLAVANINITKKYLPELKINLKLARKNSIKEIAASGIWMSFTSLSNILMRNIDTLLANVLFNQTMMGNLSTARTVPNAVTTIINSIGTVFTPTFVSLYAQNKHQDLVNEAKNSIRINGLIIIVPVSGFIAFSRPFYNLWLPNVDKETLSLIIFLSTITIIQAYFNSTTMALAQLSVVVNKLKMPVLISFGVGVLNLIIELLLAKFTDIGIAILVVPSTIIMCLRYVIFNSWYAAKIINTKSKYFYKTILRTLLPIPLLLAFFYFVSTMLTLNSWVKLISAAVVCGIIGYAVSAVIIIPKKEIKNILSKIKNKIKA